MINKALILFILITFLILTAGPALCQEIDSTPVKNQPRVGEWVKKLAGFLTNLIEIIKEKKILQNWMEKISGFLNFKKEEEKKEEKEESKPECVVGGCGGELCAPAGQAPMVSICIFKPEHACYKDARCEVQEDGECGWTETEELKACLGK